MRHLDMMFRTITLILYISCCLSVLLPTNFPIKRYFNISESSNIEYSGGLVQYTCSGEGDKCCDCNSDCMRYKTCCIDKLWDKNNPIPIDIYLDRFVNETRKYKDLTCESLLTLPKNSGHGSEKLLMVSTCLPTASRVDIAKCISKTSEVSSPVFGIDKYLYKSSSCAKCNSIHQFEIVNITADCKGPETNIYRPQSPTTPPPPPTTKLPLNINLLTRFTECLFPIS